MENEHLMVKSQNKSGLIGVGSSYGGESLPNGTFNFASNQIHKSTNESYLRPAPQPRSPTYNEVVKMTYDNSETHSPNRESLIESDMPFTFANKHSDTKPRAVEAKKGETHHIK